MKLYITKGKYEYYTTITGKNKNDEDIKTYISVQVSKAVGELPKQYGLFDVDGFMSCYENSEGEVIPKIIITSVKDSD